MRNYNTNTQLPLKFIASLTILLFAISSTIQAQITGDNGETLLGNEWIDYDQEYFKLMVAEDGVYRVTASELTAAGVPLDQISGSTLKLFHFGKEQYLHVSNNGNLSQDDYIEFVGVKNRGELDQHLYSNPDDMLNPEYSLYTDTTAYFLTWDDTPGKRYEVKQTDLSGNTLSPEEYFWAEDIKYWTNSVSKPVISQLRSSDYQSAEGYSSGYKITNSYQHQTSHRAVEVGGAEVEITLSGNNLGGINAIEAYINNQLVSTQDIPSISTTRVTLDVDNQNLGDNVAFAIKSVASSKDRNTLGVSVLRYPRLFKFDGQESFKFDMAPLASSRYIELEAAGDQSSMVLDPSNGIYYNAALVQNKQAFVLNDIPARATLFFTNVNNVKSVVGISKSIMVDYSGLSNTEYLIISSKALNAAHTDGVNYLEAYAEYRASDLGGSYNSNIVFVEDLYDQFAYGLHRHPLSIKNFGYWTKAKWSGLKYCFFIGKGQEYPLSRTKEQLEEDGDLITLNHFVPTFGFPGSDYMLFSEKGHTRSWVPVGRIAADQIVRIKNYYDKIVLRENPLTYPQTIEGRKWTKNVMHLSGGRDATEFASINGTLDQMAEGLENSFFGANVFKYAKQNSNAIQSAVSESLLNNINSGVSILSFFGHSTYGTFDFSLEKAKQYDNKGKLPVIFSMGCNSGNIFIKQESISEDFVLEPEVGSIAFMAASSTALLGTQGVFGRRFYEAIGGDFYGRNLGDVLFHLFELHDTAQNINDRSLNAQFTLHGDPALKMIAYAAADYTIDAPTVSIDPEIVSPQDEDFTLSFDVVNIGRAIQDSMDIEVVTLLKDGTPKDTLRTKIKAPQNKSEVLVTVPNSDKDAIGENCIAIEIDPDNKIAEGPTPIAEANNKLQDVNMGENFCYFLLDDSAFPVLPREFAIVNESDPTLIASSSNAMDDVNTYVMQIDTTAKFNSDALRTTEITNSAGLLQWQPNLTLNPGTVYYWRVSADSTDVNIGYKWNSSSFIYLPNSSEGWNQSHYYQYLDNDLSGIEFQDRKLDFLDQGVSLFLAAKLSVLQNQPRFILNGNTEKWLRMWDYNRDGLGIVRLDGKNVDFYENQSPGLHGSSLYTGGTRRIFFYPTDNQESRINFMNHVEEIVNAGDHVYIFTVTNKNTADLHIEEWAADSLVNNGKNIFNVVESKGATKIRQLQDFGTVPYCMVYTEGEGIIDEAIAPSIFKPASISASFYRNYIEGTFRSQLVGPATSWDKAIWQVEQQADDEVQLMISGYHVNGTIDTFYTTTNEAEIDLSSIDAQLYPYLQLEMYARDEVDRSPSDLKFWRILYSGVGELAYLRDDDFYFKSDTLNQGETLMMSIKVQNISKQDMGNVDVRYTIKDARNASIVSSEVLDPIASSDSRQIKFEYDTKDLSGDHQLLVEVNPDKSLREYNYSNNVGVRPFHVRVDDRKPNLDVTFDGLHIINGDIVSPEPNILIEIRDDNQYLLLDQEDIFTLKLVDPNGNVTDYTVEESEISFEPATDASDNKAKIIFNPKFETEGTYKMIVQAKDASGNFSGKNDYVVEFEVILSESISNIFNYPNPFSTSTQFVFTLTGSQVPDDLSITILTISGKVVKEITREELGNLRIGHNRTAYKWDGTDEYGEKLGNGVYLYKINLPKDMERYNTGTDQFFEKDFGKLVIMR